MATESKEYCFHCKEMREVVLDRTDDCDYWLCRSCGAVVDSEFKDWEDE
jgi:hypothetical protein